MGWDQGWVMALPRKTILAQLVQKDCYHSTHALRSFSANIYSSQEHLSMEPNSIINSVKDLSDQRICCHHWTSLDVGHKLCLLHSHTYT